MKNIFLKIQKIAVYSLTCNRLLNCEMISAVCGRLQSNMTENYMRWNKPKGEEKVHSCGTNPCSLDAKYSKERPRGGLYSEQGWKLLTKTSQTVLWSQPGLSVISGRCLSPGIPRTGLWASPTASSGLCWSGDTGGAAGTPMHMEGCCMGPSKLCSMGAAPVQLRFWCGYWFLQELF